MINVLKKLKFNFIVFKEKNKIRYKNNVIKALRITYLIIKQLIIHLIFSFFLLISLNIFKIIENLNLINYLKSVALLFIISEIADFLIKFKPVNRK